MSLLPCPTVRGRGDALVDVGLGALPFRRRRISTLPIRTSSEPEAAAAPMPASPQRKLPPEPTVPAESASSVFVVVPPSRDAYAAVGKRSTQTVAGRSTAVLRRSKPLLVAAFWG